MSDPVIHVFLASYNRERFLEPAIESVLGQTYGALRLWIFEDASTDGSLDVARRWARAEPERIVLRARTTNQGLRRNFNEMLREVGDDEYLAVHAHDDLCLPHRIEESVKALQAAPEAAMVHSDAELIDEAGQLVGRRFSDLWIAPTNERSVARRLFVDGNFICATTVTLRGAAIRELDLEVPTPFELCMDYYSWLRLAARWPVVELADPVTRYRVSPGQMTERSRETQRESLLIPRAAYRASPELRRLIPSGEAKRALGRRARTYLHRREIDGEPADAAWYGLRLLRQEPSWSALRDVVRALRGARRARARARARR